MYQASYNKSLICTPYYNQYTFCAMNATREAFPLCKVLCHLCPVSCHLYTAGWLLLAGYCQLYNVRCLMTAGYCQLSSVSWLLSTIYCQLVTVFVFL